MTTTTEVNFDAFAEGNALDEQQLEAVGFRRLHHFNEHHLRRNTPIERGGYAIDDDNGDAPDIGPSISMRHQSNRSSIKRVATTVEVALIGFTQRYLIYEGVDPATEKWRSVIAPQWIDKSEGLPGWRCRGALSYFIALQVDSKRELWELVFKGKDPVQGAVRMISEAKAFASQVGQYIAKERGITVRPHAFMLWLPLSVGETVMTGSEEQSPVTPPAWKIGKDEDLMQRLVSGDDYRTFIELRKQLDDYLAQGRYSGNGNGAQQLQLPQRQAAPALAAPNGNQFDGNGNYAKSNGDVNI